MHGLPRGREVGVTDTPCGVWHRVRSPRLTGHREGGPETKRYAIFVAALLLLLPGSSAQGQVTPTLSGGLGFAERVFGHANHTLGEDKPRSRHGRALGITAGFPMSGTWGIQPGAGLSEKGYHREHTCWPPWSRRVSEFPCTAENLIPYLEFTLLADRRFELADRARLHLLAGPFLGFQRDSLHTVWILREGETTRGLTRKVEAFDRGAARGSPARNRGARQPLASRRYTVHPWVHEDRHGAGVEGQCDLAAHSVVLPRQRIRRQDPDADVSYRYHLFDRLRLDRPPREDRPTPPPPPPPPTPPTRHPHGAPSCECSRSRSGARSRRQFPWATGRRPRSHSPGP